MGDSDLLPYPNQARSRAFPASRVSPDEVASLLNVYLAHARQIRRVKTSITLAEPRQFQAQKNLCHFEFGQLFLARRGAYHEL
jgi:hypothetical protein